MSHFEVQGLVDVVECFGVDAFRQVRVLFGPVLEDEFEIGTDADGFLKQFFDMFIEEEFEGVGDKHQIEDEIFVLRLIVGVADDIAYLLRILGDEFILDVPVGLPNHVGEEDRLDLIHQEDFGHGFEDFVDWVAECDVATAGH